MLYAGIGYVGTAQNEMFETGHFLDMQHRFVSDRARAKLQDLELLPRFQCREPGAANP